MAQLWEKYFLSERNLQRGRRRSEINRKLVGAAVLLGTAVGCFHYQSLYTRYYRSTRLVHIINYGMKVGQTCGIVTLMFTGFESALSALREKDDEANTVLAATATGYLYGSTRGFQRMVYSGAAGVTLGMILAIYTSRGNLINHWKTLLIDFVYAKDISDR